MVIFPILFHDPELPISSNARKVVALVLSIFLQSKRSLVLVLLFSRFQKKKIQLPCLI